MAEHINVFEIVFKFLQQFHFEENDLDYGLVSKHIHSLQKLSDISNSGVTVFDVCRKDTLFYSANFGKLLGYKPADYENLNHVFFDGKMHPEEKQQLAVNGISVLKIFNKMSTDEKLNHKAIYEYRMLNADNKYVRLVEQYQVLELDKKGQLWLLMSIVDVSPNQEVNSELKCRILNFKTGNFLPVHTAKKPELELTKRELEILKLVKQGFLSKEISDQLSISIHTVNTHRQRFLEKLGVSNSIEAVTFAARYGLVE